jgi:thiamine monophosphate synthase
MISFFILDTNALSKQKIEKTLKGRKIKEIIVRNRGGAKESGVENTFILKQKPFIQADLRNKLRIQTKGVHNSLFYDKMRSKRLFSNVQNVKKTASAHNLREVLQVLRELRANFIIISPIFKTESHLNGKNLGILKLFRLINQVPFANFIIMGGVSEKKALKVKKLDFKSKIKGFASIRNF